MGAAVHAEETVQIIDDDLFTLTMIRGMLRVAGFEVQTFSSPGVFLATAPPAGPTCTVLDLNMPEIDGLAVMSSIEGRRDPAPVVILSGLNDVPTTVRAMKKGAVDYLCKPVAAEDLIAAVRRALDLHASRLRASAEADALRSLFGQLTLRERQVCEMAAAGLLNKQIADELRLHERTVKLHRSEGMRKLRATSVPDLVRILDRIRRLEPLPGGSQ